jgi:hypothetical protein
VSLDCLLKIRPGRESTVPVNLTISWRQLIVSGKNFDCDSIARVRVLNHALGE